VVYKHELDPLHGEMLEYETLGERFLVGVISVTAIFRPKCSADMSSFGNAS
jgi:hypothetical protein